MSALLEVQNLEAFYGDFQALFGINAHIDEAECVSFIGANGAGKSTLMRCFTGLIQPRSGQLSFDKASLIGQAPPFMVGQGIAMVPEGRRLFSSLSVEENLKIGAYKGRKGPWTLERLFNLFPILEERRKQAATTLSGGQQQMVAIGRALMSNPRLLLCDELSLGLAPVVIKDIYDALPEIRAEGMAVIIVEQDIRQALAVSDRVYCLAEGRVTLEGQPDALDLADVKQAYFGAEKA